MGNTDHKKIILVGFSSPMHIKAAKKMTQQGIEIVYWLGRKSNFDSLMKNPPKELSSTIFHNSFEALRGNPAVSVSMESLEYPDINVWGELSSCEASVLEMIDRIDYDGMSIVEKRVMYYRYVVYWYGIIKKYKPNAIIFTDIPHAGFNFVMYRLAKILGIKTILIKRTKGVPDRVLFFEDMCDYKELRHEYERLQKKPFTINDLSKKIKDFYLKESIAGADLSKEHSGEIYTQIKSKSRLTKTFPELKTIIRHITRGTFFTVARGYIQMIFRKHRWPGLKSQEFYGWQIKYRYWKSNILNRKLEHEYGVYQQPVDWSVPFVYFPMHLQPECSTNPQGKIFSNQFLVLDMLSRSLPSGWKIYVKENPMQWRLPVGYLGRFSGYYSSLADNPRVVIIPAHTSTYSLISKCHAVATITGTAAWEACLQGKPSIIFGCTWFQDCEGIFKVGTEHECRAVLNKIADGFKPDKDMVVRFLGAVEKIAMEGFPSKKFGLHSSITQEENISKLAEYCRHYVTQV